MDADERARRLFFHGMLLVVAGLLMGTACRPFANPRIGLSAHTGTLMNGILVIALGALWPRLDARRRASRRRVLGPRRRQLDELRRSLPRRRLRHQPHDAAARRGSRRLGGRRRHSSAPCSASGASRSRRMRGAAWGLRGSDRP